MKKTAGILLALLLPFAAQAAKPALKLTPPKPDGDAVEIVATTSTPPHTGEPFLLQKQDNEVLLGLNGKTYSLIEVNFYELPEKEAKELESSAGNQWSNGKGTSVTLKNVKPRGQEFTADMIVKHAGQTLSLKAVLKRPDPSGLSEADQLALRKHAVLRIGQISGARCQVQKQPRAAELAQAVARLETSEATALKRAQALLKAGFGGVDGPKATERFERGIAATEEKMQAQAGGDPARYCAMAAKLLSNPP